MRVSSKQFFEGLGAQVARNQARLNRLQVQAASGSQVVEVSDDPAGVARALSLQSVLSELQQFRRNAESVKQGLNSTDTALGQLTETLRSLKGVALRAANQPLAKEERANLASQIDQLTRALVDTLNARHGDTPLFSGTAGTKQPFALTPAGSRAFLYDGDSGERTVQVGPAAHVAANVPGSRLFSREEEDVLTAFRTLREQLSSPDGIVDADAALRVTDAAHASVLALRGEVGNRVAMLEAQTAQLEVAEENAQAAISGIMEADLARTVVELRTAETVYEASIATTARIARHSLLDFLQ